MKGDERLTYFLISQQADFTWNSTFKTIAGSIAGAALLLALVACITRQFPAVLFFVSSIYLAAMFPLTARWAVSLVAAEEAINDRHGKEIGLAIRKFHADRGAYPRSWGELRPQY